ncbi:MAG: YdhR family protein [Clostridia bacterium]|nr:YdhR family protein [Clostridia bacterium]
MNTNPLMGFLFSILFLVMGRVKFFKESIGREMVMEDGRKFKVFRHVKIKPASKRMGEPEAVFKIRFQPANMGVEENKRFSVIPMMIILGFKGLRSKFWMVDEKTGLCQGLYEWQTLEDAKNYSRSIALTFMTKRSVPGTVSFEIIPQGKEKYWPFR